MRIWRNGSPIFLTIIYIFAIYIFTQFQGKLIDYLTYYEIAHVAIKTNERAKRKISIISNIYVDNDTSVKLNYKRPDTARKDYWSNNTDSLNQFKANHIDDINGIIKAYNQTFEIRLKPSTKILSPESFINIYQGNNFATHLLSSFQNAHIYTGIVLGDSESSIIGSLLGPKFSAVLIYKNVVYHIEPINNYLKNSTKSYGPNPKVKSSRVIIYRDSDLRDIKLSSAYTNNDIIAKLKRRQAALVYKPKNILHPMFNQPYVKGIFQNESISIKRTKLLKKNDIIWTFKSINRALKSNIYSKTCSVNLVADHKYVQCMKEAGKNPVDEMIFHILAVDSIYRTVDFDGDKVADNIGFMVKNVTLFKDDNITGYKLNNYLINANDYLNSFSEYDWSGYCLSLAFTCRTFEEGILGLTWIADSDINGRAGGICQIRGFLEEDGKEYSFNTGIFTIMHKSKLVPQHISLITVTHELGHALGSYHDNVTQCLGDGPSQGTYLMFSEASTGGKRNNWLFSECSKEQITKVLRIKGTCLDGPECGNGVIDFGEECDCGPDETCEKWDPCCNPPNNRHFLLSVQDFNNYYEPPKLLVTNISNNTNMIRSIDNSLFYLQNISEDSKQENDFFKDFSNQNLAKHVLRNPKIENRTKQGRGCTLRRDKGYMCTPLNDECCNEFCQKMNPDSIFNNDSHNCKLSFNKRRNERLSDFLFQENQINHSHAMKLFKINFYFISLVPFWNIFLHHISYIFCFVP
ncbi:unnamed protein product [Gordionus sp. m RMFG-2023]